VVKGCVVFHVKQSLADAEAAKQRIEHVLGRGASGQAVEGQTGRAQPLGQHERVAERNGVRQGVRRHLDEFPLAPAQGQRFRMEGTVVKPGRTLTVVEGRAYAIDEGREKLIATMSATVMAIFGRDGVRH